MNLPSPLLIGLALLLVGVLVLLHFRTIKPPAGAQLLADLWKQLPREQREDTRPTPQPSPQAEVPSRTAATSSRTRLSDSSR